jgi:hypothetical protein
MKMALILFATMLLCETSFAKTTLPAPDKVSEAIVYLNYHRGPLQRQFWIREAAPGSMSVSFQENKKPATKKMVPEAEARLLVRFFDDLYRKNKDKAVADPSKCTPYATLTILNETPLQICKENAKATGELYDLLTKLHVLSK